MIDLHFWPTPNGFKALILVEEAELAYRVTPVNINLGEQFRPEFLSIAPNNRIPAIVDSEPADGGAPITVFESGAILEYLADKAGRFLSAEPRARVNTMQWLFWQMAGLGPIAGQNHHFGGYAAEELPYAINRFVNETGRLYAVLDKQLQGRDYITGDYSIADMACYPWIVYHERQRQNLEDFQNIQKWFEWIGNRPAVTRAYQIGRSITSQPSASNEQERATLFGQSASTVTR